MTCFSPREKVLFMWILGEFIQWKDRKQQSPKPGSLLTIPQGAKTAVPAVVLLTQKIELASFCIHILRGSFPIPKKKNPLNQLQVCLAPCLYSSPSVCMNYCGQMVPPVSYPSIDSGLGDDTEVKDQPLCTLCRLWGMLTWGAWSSRKVKSESIFKMLNSRSWLCNH